MRSVTRITLFLTLLTVIGGVHFMFGQGTDLGTIVGLVTDTSGAVVPNAKVVVLDLGTNTPRDTKTNAQGEYRVFGLKSGAYQVLVSAPGMGTTRINGVQVNGSDAINANAVLKVAAATRPSK